MTDVGATDMSSLYDRAAEVAERAEPVLRVRPRRPVSTKRNLVAALEEPHRRAHAHHRIVEGIV